MTKKSQLDNLIKIALAEGEGKIRPGNIPLEKAKIRLNMENSMKNRKAPWSPHLYKLADIFIEKSQENRRTPMNAFISKRTLKWPVVAAVILLVTSFALITSAKGLFKTDKTDYPFVEDPQVIGKWQSVDFVKTMDEFSPEKKSWSEDLYLKELAFIKDGKMLISFAKGNGNLAYAPMTWTKGMIVNKEVKTASKYVIKEIGGSSYMFYEWKSGDYTINDMQPQFYVLKKTNSNDYSKKEAARKIDKIDYPFVDDPQAIGKWESVDFVETIDKFNPDQKSYLMELFLTDLIFKEKGRITACTTKGNSPDASLSWTKGIVINPNEQTASKYEIKEINGAVYMFYEWKSGDYTLRGMQPQFYVLKKVE